ncbi:MAG: hypothetical protein EWV84_17250 [Microcystis sp. M_QC_C_20170808_M3Col]|nr:MAG: hypothetical protein EWV84_17250 [Microcystis sp. M_QC_C_20170808_M3Col]
MGLGFKNPTKEDSYLKSATPIGFVGARIFHYECTIMSSRLCQEKIFSNQDLGSIIVYDSVLQQQQSFRYFTD